jgi:hypothetical protein
LEGRCYEESRQLQFVYKSCSNRIARTLFGLKNRAGSIATNSIDTNGTRYQGEISLRQHAIDAAQEHQNRIGLEQYKLNLQDV